MRFKSSLFFTDQPGAAGGGQAPDPQGQAPDPQGQAPASALSAGATPPAADAKPAGPNDWVPEKFRVMKPDGNMDLEASARKVEEHRSNLEKRLGSGDIPPATADEYKFNVPEKFAANIKPEDLAKDTMMKSFLTNAHAAGLSQKQVDMVVGEYLERLPAMGEALATLSAEECTTELKDAWKTDAEYKKNIQLAYKAGMHGAGAEFEAILNEHGNDPKLIKMLAKFGSEMGEDIGTPSGAHSKDAQQSMKDEHAKLAEWVNNPVNQKKAEFDAKNRRYADLGKAIFGEAVRTSGSSINVL